MHGTLYDAFINMHSYITAIVFEEVGVEIMKNALEELIKRKSYNGARRWTCNRKCSTVQPQLSELIGGKECSDNWKYLKSNIHSFTYRAMLNYSNKACTHIGKIP